MALLPLHQLGQSPDRAAPAGWPRAGRMSLAPLKLSRRGALPLRESASQDGVRPGACSPLGPHASPSSSETSALCTDTAQLLGPSWSRGFPEGRPGAAGPVLKSEDRGRRKPDGQSSQEPILPTLKVRSPKSLRGFPLLPRETPEPWASSSRCTPMRGAPQASAHPASSPVMPFHP